MTKREREEAFAALVAHPYGMAAMEMSEMMLGWRWAYSQYTKASPAEQLARQRFYDVVNGLRHEIKAARARARGRA